MGTIALSVLVVCGVALVCAVVVFVIVALRDGNQ